MLQFKEDESIEGNKNRLPSSELVSPVMPVKTVAKSSAATPAAPKAMPEAALPSHVLGFLPSPWRHHTFFSEYPRKQGEEREKRISTFWSPLSLSLLAVCPSCGLPALLPVFSSLSLGIYIRLVTSQKLEGRRGHLFTKLTIFTFYFFI